MELASGGWPPVVVASRPEALADGALLTGLPQDAVVALAAEGTDQELAHRLGPGGRAAVREVGLRVVAVQGASAAEVGRALAVCLQSPAAGRWLSEGSWRRSTTRKRSTSTASRSCPVFRPPAPTRPPGGTGCTRSGPVTPRRTSVRR